MNQYERRLRKLLEQQAHICRPMPGYAYVNGADFVLQHGSFVAPGLWQKEWPRGAPRLCFGNAITNCLTNDGWSYWEGYAMPCVEGKLVPLPVHHGWNRRPDGVLVDSTWQNTGVAYMGVHFCIGRVDDAIWRGDASVLDDWKRSWPLFQQQWTGEPEDAVWEPTECLLLQQELAKRKKAGLPYFDLYDRFDELLAANT